CRFCLRPSLAPMTKDRKRGAQSTSHCLLIPITSWKYDNPRISMFWKQPIIQKIAIVGPYHPLLSPGVCGNVLVAFPGQSYFASEHHVAALPAQKRCNL